MKVKKLKKLYFKKAIIAKINKTVSHGIKGGTRSFNEDESGRGTHCGDYICF